MTLKTIKEQIEALTEKNRKLHLRIIERNKAIDRWKAQYGKNIWTLNYLKVKSDNLEDNE